MKAIVRDIEIETSEDGISFIDGMDKFIGKEIEVSHAKMFGEKWYHSNEDDTGCNYHWHESWLELPSTGKQRIELKVYKEGRVVLNASGDADVVNSQNISTDALIRHYKSLPDVTEVMVRYYYEEYLCEEE